jgi:hypothetical protein
VGEFVYLLINTYARTNTRGNSKVGHFHEIVGGPIAPTVLAAAGYCAMQGYTNFPPQNSSYQNSDVKYVAK